MPSVGLVQTGIGVQIATVRGSTVTYKCGTSATTFLTTSTSGVKPCTGSLNALTSEFDSIRVVSTYQSTVLGALPAFCARISDEQDFAGQGGLQMRIQLKRTPNNDHGAIAILVAILAVVLIVFAAFSVDLGYAYSTKRQLQVSTDASALAAAQSIGLKIPIGSSETPPADLQADCVSLLSNVNAQGLAETAVATSTAANSSRTTATDVQVSCAVDNGQQVIDVAVRSTREVPDFPRPQSSASRRLHPAPWPQRESPLRKPVRDCGRSLCVTSTLGLQYLSPVPRESQRTNRRSRIRHASIIRAVPLCQLSATEQHLAQGTGASLTSRISNVGIEAPLIDPWTNVRIPWNCSSTVHL